MKNVLKLILAVLFSFTASSSLHAKGIGTSGGATLMQAPGARSAALGEAFTAVTNDVTAFAYNPASLKSLRGGHASFEYQRGIAEDSYGQFIIGSPLANGNGAGLSVESVC